MLSNSKLSSALYLSLMALFLGTTVLHAESNYDLADSYYAKQSNGLSLQSYDYYDTTGDYYDTTGEDSFYTGGLSSNSKYYDGVSYWYYYITTDSNWDVDLHFDDGGYTFDDWDGNMYGSTYGSHEGDSDYEYYCDKYFLGRGWLLPVHRFYSPTKKVHFFTISFKEAADLSNQWYPSGWNYEGVTHYAWAKQAYGTIPLYRFWSKVTGCHFFTVNKEEKDRLQKDNNWRFEGIAYYVMPPSNAGLGGVPVYRLYSKTKGYHFYTTSIAERNSLSKDSQTWQYDGVAYKVVDINSQIRLQDYYAAVYASETGFQWLELEAANLPHRYVSVQHGAVFPQITPPVLPGYIFNGYYSTDALFNDVIDDYYKYYGMDGKSVEQTWDGTSERIYSLYDDSTDFLYDDVPLNLIPLFIAPSSEVVTTSIYRLRSLKTGRHFYTKNSSERDSLSNGGSWVYEGVAYRAFSNFTIGSVPLYRFCSTVTGSHFYTINESEKNNLLSNPGWRFEGIAYYVEATSQNGGNPVYRFWSPTKKYHFFSINVAEIQPLLASKDWKYEGIAFYAPTRTSSLSLAFNNVALEVSDWALSHNGEVIDSVGEMSIEDFAVITSEESPSEDELERQGELFDGLTLTLRIPNGQYTATLLNVASGEYVEAEAVQGDFDLALSKINTWYRLEVKDLDGEIVYSLWLMVK